MPTYASGGASRGEQHDGIAHQLRVVLERGELLMRQLWVARIELEPRETDAELCADQKVRFDLRLQSFEVEWKLAVGARHDGRCESCEIDCPQSL